jgi:hypothetical protein
MHRTLSLPPTLPTGFYVSQYVLHKCVVSCTIPAARVPLPAPITCAARQQPTVPRWPFPPLGLAFNRPA